jgi:hypothetical protein
MHSAEVATKAGVVDEETWHRIFPDAPALPEEAFAP